MNLEYTDCPNYCQLKDHLKEALTAICTPESTGSNTGSSTLSAIEEQESIPNATHQDEVGNKPNSSSDQRKPLINLNIFNYVFK